MPKGELIYRCEHDDWDFLDGRGSLVDGVVIPARYLAPYPEGHASRGKDPRRLLHAARAIGRIPLVDPDTAGLRSVAVLRSGAARLRLTSSAMAVELPLDLSQLAERRRFEAFVDATLEGQPGTDHGVAAPYLDYGLPNGVEFGLNIRMLERTVASVGRERTVGFLQSTRSRLISGDMSRMVPRIAATGARRILIRVRGLAAEEASVEEVLEYAWVVDLLDRHGVEAIPDCVGRLGPFLVATRAHAFTTGSHNFRSVPAALLSVRDKDPNEEGAGSGGGGGGRPITYELPEGGELARELAPTIRSDFGRSKSESAAKSSARQLDGYRAHRLQVLRGAARGAVDDPDGFLRDKQSSDDAYERAWATALLERLRRTA